MKQTKGQALTQAMPQDSTPQITAPDAGYDPTSDHEAKGHLQTLVDAHGIQQDPVKMGKVHALAGRHMAAIKGLVSPKSAVSSVADLKALKNKKFTQGDGE